jgi:hypothetical protein
MPCGKRLRWGEDAVAISGTMHCPDCSFDERPAPMTFWVRMTHGAICGGGFEQD